MIKSNKFVRLALFAATLIMAALLTGCPDSGPSQKYSDEEVVKRLTAKLEANNSEMVTLTHGEISHSKGTVIIKNSIFKVTDPQGIVTTLKAETVTLKGFNHDFLDDETPKGKIIFANEIVAQNLQVIMGMDEDEAATIVQYTCENMNLDGLAFNPSLLEVVISDIKKLEDGQIKQEVFLANYMNALKEISYDSQVVKNLKGQLTMPFEDTKHNFAIENLTSKNFKNLAVELQTLSNITAESPFYNFSTESMTFKDFDMNFMADFVAKMDTADQDALLQIFYDAKILQGVEIKNMALKVSGEDFFSLKRFTSKSKYEPEYSNTYAFEGIVLNKSILTGIEGMIGFAALGMDSITFDHNAAYSISKDMKTFTLNNFTFDVKDLALFDLALKLKDITEKAPYNDPFEEFEIHNIVMNYEDKGLMPRALNIASMLTFQDAGSLLAEVLKNLDVNNAPANLSEKNVQYAQSMVKDLALFIENPGKLTFAIKPSKPISSEAFGRNETFETLLSNKEVTLTVKKGASILESAQKLKAGK